MPKSRQQVGRSCSISVRPEYYAALKKIAADREESIARIVAEWVVEATSPKKGKRR
mgnify:CR=1 FL=1